LKTQVANLSFTLEKHTQKTEQEKSASTARLQMLTEELHKKNDEKRKLQEELSNKVNQLRCCCHAVPRLTHGEGGNVWQ
jgi:hypothetical protein